MKNVLYAVVTIFLLLGVLSASITAGIKGWRTVDTTQSFAIVTGGGVTTSNVTLASTLFLESVAEVIAVTSNITETPVATSYDEDSQKLLVSALASGETRSLTVNYYADTESVVVKTLGGFLSLIIFGFLLVMTLKRAFKK